MSYVLSFLGLASMIAASLVKGKRMTAILLLVFFGNALVAAGYLIDGSINGAVSCGIGAVQTLINSFFDRRDKKLPTWLIAVYAAAFVGCNLAAGFTWLGLLAIAASLTFVFCIGQKNGARYRIWTIINSVLWCLYDVLAMSFGALITHVSLLTFTVAGMIIHDRKHKYRSV